MKKIAKHLGWILLATTIGLVGGCGSMQEKTDKRKAEPSSSAQKTADGELPGGDSLKLNIHHVNDGIKGLLNHGWYLRAYYDVGNHCGVGPTDPIYKCKRNKSDWRSKKGCQVYDCAVNHWFRHGRFECRQPRSGISPGDYLARYSDLRNAGLNCGSAMRHYVVHGKKYCMAGNCESRNAKPFKRK